MNVVIILGHINHIDLCINVDNPNLKPYTMIDFKTKGVFSTTNLFNKKLNWW